MQETRDSSSIPGSGRSPGGRHGNSLQYSCPENPLDRGARPATIHRVATSRTHRSTSWTQVGSSSAHTRSSFVHCCSAPSLSSICRWFHIILSITLWGRYYLRFIDKDTKMLRNYVARLNLCSKWKGGFELEPSDMYLILLHSHSSLTACFPLLLPFTSLESCWCVIKM